MFENIELIKQDVRIISQPTVSELKNTEFVARLSHRSDDRISNDSHIKFLDKITTLKHEAVFEFLEMTVLMTTNRGISHELVRHRLCSFLQESTRYVNFDRKLDGKIPIIRDDYPMYMLQSLDDSAYAYKKAVQDGILPQKARDILPMALATRIAVKANLRQWAFMFNERLLNKKAHPQFRWLMSALLNRLHGKLTMRFIADILQHSYRMTDEQYEDARGVCLDD